MCIICVDFQKGIITNKEARGHLREVGERLSIEHQEELMIMLYQDSIVNEDEVEEVKP